VGARATSVGTGLFTVNPPARVSDPPPGGLLVTITSCAPVDAVGKMVIDAVNPVKLSTVTELTVIPVPMLKLVTPLKKFEPPTTTFIVWRRFPNVGAIDVTEGIGLLPTINP
jgi:hypothetical protein